MSTQQAGRKRDGAVTREAILQAAVVEFTEHGYARAGVRQIAERAGVTAMMINRYFGSAAARPAGHPHALLDTMCEHLACTPRLLDARCTCFQAVPSGHGCAPSHMAGHV
ncbi:helix-turn-helix domain-containing protein [Streptomyces sp. NPDC006743]|uniref:TetR/AcrR family transcriptional regulator n=1 Tax=Streptomyces sp. NPDC006743 TaxID=3154480 RepID=UPI00345720AE